MRVRLLILVTAVALLTGVVGAEKSRKKDAAFTARGELVGIVTIRTNRGGRAGILPVILPVEDILEDMQQIEPPKEDEEAEAKEEPKEEKKEEKKAAKKE